MATITELTTSRDVSVVTKAEDEQKASQTTAPRHIEPHSTGRPWNRRAALHTMPTAMNSMTSARLDGIGGEIRSPRRHSTPENPPIRYAVPHQASAVMPSCIHANSRNSPSNDVTQMAMTKSVPMSSDIAASARLATMIRAPLTQPREPVSPIAARRWTFTFQALPNVRRKPRVFRKNRENWRSENCSSDNCSEKLSGAKSQS